MESDFGPAIANKTVLEETSMSSTSSAGKMCLSNRCRISVLMEGDVMHSIPEGWM